MTIHKRFIVVFFLPILLAMPIGVANYIFLFNAGELESIETIARSQKLSGGLYGTAVHNNSYAYKLTIYKSRRPEVIVIGSSRVLQFRDRYFTKSFVNLGRTVDYPGEAEQLVADMLRIAKPKLVIFGIDYWWGNRRWKHAYTFARHEEVGGRLTPDAMLAPTNWLIDGKFSLDTYIDVLRGGRPMIVGGVPMFGVQAIIDGNGFGPDGAYYYSKQISGRGQATDSKFADTLARIQAGTAQFRYGSDVMAERIDSLRRTLAELNQANVPTITFLPPLAPTVAETIRKMGDQYAYIPKFREQIAALNHYHYDFLDPVSLNAGDCEFVDGFHGGEVVFLRMLANMAGHTDNGLAPFVDLKKVRMAIKAHAGKAIVDTRYQRGGEREVDFLGLGCEKT